MLIHKKDSKEAFICLLKKMMHMQLWPHRVQEKEWESELVANPFDSSFIEDETNLIMDWWLAFEDQDPMIDKFGNPPCLSYYVYELIDNENVDEWVQPTKSQEEFDQLNIWPFSNFKFLFRNLYQFSTCFI